MRKAFLVMLLVVVAAGTAMASSGMVKPKASDKCPVCGMFVAKYRDFQAQVINRDGSYAVFDGAKDLFKYLQNPGKYAPGKSAQEIKAIYVTDYYSLKPLDAHAAWFVIGSDVLGPMGKELIAFGKADDAAEFKKDHQGTRILRFREITPAVTAILE